MVWIDDLLSSLLCYAGSWAVDRIVSTWLLAVLWLAAGSEQQAGPATETGGPLKRRRRQSGGARPRDVTRRRASRMRPCIERHVPLAAGLLLRPTDSHIFIFLPNVAPRFPDLNRKSTLHSLKSQARIARDQCQPRGALGSLGPNPKWQDGEVSRAVREPAFDRAVLISDSTYVPRYINVTQVRVGACEQVHPLHPVTPAEQWTLEPM